MGGWSPKPAPVEPAASSVLHQPARDPAPLAERSGCIFRVRATFWPVLRSTAGRDFFDLCRWLCRL